MSKVPPVKLPPVASASPRPDKNNLDDQEEVKSNHTSDAEDPLLGLTDEQKREMFLALPPRRGTNKDTIRKPPPHPDSLMGKAFACYHKYHDRYVALVKSFDEQFTVLAREDAETARLAALHTSPPSTVASPRIDATIEDVIDLCKSRVKSGKVQRLKKLIRDNYIDVNIPSELYKGWTPAIACARAGSTKTLRVLVEECGADVNVCERHNWSPLMYAVYRGHVHTVRYLVEHCKADRTIKCKGRGWTAQMYARNKANPHQKKYRPSEVHQEIVAILRGDTPHHTPRLLQYEGDLEFRSLLFHQARKDKIEAAKIAAINCWCMNLEIRCKNCQYKIGNKTNEQVDLERAEFVKTEEEEAERRRQLFAMPAGLSDSDTDSESEEEEEEEEEEEKKETADT